jgi:hypothetical protein
MHLLVFKVFVYYLSFRDFSGFAVLDSDRGFFCVFFYVFWVIESSEPLLL